MVIGLEALHKGNAALKMMSSAALSIRLTGNHKTHGIQTQLRRLDIFMRQ